MKVIFEFFSRLEKEGWSGEVDVTSSQGHATIVIKDGQLLWAFRPLDRAMERFEKMGWVKLPSREKLSALTTWEELVGELLSINRQNYSKLVQFLKVERLELFFRIFFWTNVELVPRAYDVRLPDSATFGFYSLRRISSLLKEARKRLDEWPKIQDKIESSRRIFLSQVQLPTIYSQKDMDVIDKTMLDFGKQNVASSPLTSLPFTAEEIEILRLCDGRNSIQELIRLSGEGEFLTLRRLVDLWRKGALRPKDDEHSITNFRLPWNALSFKGFVSGLAGAAMVSLVVVCFTNLFGDSLRYYSRTSYHNEWVQTLQALYIYRKNSGSYPLSLHDLAKQNLIGSQAASRLQYTLKQPYVFELKPR